MDGEGTGSVQDKDLTLPAVLDVELTTTQLPRQPTNNHTHLAWDDELASIVVFFFLPLIMDSKIQSSYKYSGVHHGIIESAFCIASY